MRRIEEHLAHPHTAADLRDGPHSPEPPVVAPAPAAETTSSPAEDKHEPGWVDRMGASLLAAVVQNLHVTVENLKVVVVCPLSLRPQHFGT